MKTHEVILALRNKAGLSQEELAQKIFVTRQYPGGSRAKQFPIPKH